MNHITQEADNSNHEISSGILFHLIDWFLNSLKYLCLVEVIKCAAIKLSGKDIPIEKRLSYSRHAVDIYIIFKWAVLSLLWILKISDRFMVIFIWYLLATNLYSYFYYHTWASHILSDPFLDIDRIKRRFSSLILAILFSIFGFAYLYSVPYSEDFLWLSTIPNPNHAIWYSISNSLTANYDQVKPLTDLGYSISMIQLVMMFAFLTIIIGGSIPQIGSIIREDKNGLQE